MRERAGLQRPVGVMSRPGNQAQRCTQSAALSFAHLVKPASNARITSPLVLFGVAGMPAAVCFGRIYPRRSREFLLAPVALLAACLLLLFLFRVDHWHTVAPRLRWGGLIITFGLAMQAQVLEFAPDAKDLAVSLLSALYNAGIGAGALVGNHLAHDFRLPWIGSFGGIVGAFRRGVLLDVRRDRASCTKKFALVNIKSGEHIYGGLTGVIEVLLHFGALEARKLMPRRRDRFDNHWC